jgi:hypothetical protein
MQAKTEGRWHELRCETRICNLSNGVTRKSLAGFLVARSAHAARHYALQSNLLAIYPEQRIRLGRPGIVLLKCKNPAFTISSLLRSSKSRGKNTVPRIPVAHFSHHIILLPTLTAKDQGQQNPAAIVGDILLAVNRQVSISLRFQGCVNSVAATDKLVQRKAKAGKPVSGLGIPYPSPTVCASMPERIFFR